MLTTLQWYIFREMGKTFVLAAIGLTAVVGMGGGVMNLVELEQVTPAQLLRLMLLLLPVASCLTLPVAALYSATATYGRMSADNEFVACRSSGINIHRLFLPPLTLSLLIATLTFYFTSFLIPGLVRGLSELAKSDLRQFVLQRLESPKRLGFPNVPVKIYADRPAPSADNSNAIVLDGVAFLKLESMDEESEPEYVQYGAAESIIIEFIQDGKGDTFIQGELINATVFDRERPSGVDVGNQQLLPSKLPQQLAIKEKWFDLGELIRSRRNPQRSPEVAKAVEETRKAMILEAFLDEVLTIFADGGQLTLADSAAEVSVKAGQATLNDNDSRIALTNVEILETRDGRERTITGSSATIKVGVSTDADRPVAQIRIDGDVVVQESGARQPQKNRERLAGVALPDHIISSIGSIDDVVLLNGEEVLDLGPVAEKKRQAAIKRAAKFVRRVTSELHSRLSFSVSAFVLVILGAALGIVFRGSHMLAAFGISFVPALLVIVLNIMGRQLAEKQGTVVLGLCVIWGAIIAVALIDVWVLGRVVRR